MAQYTSVQYVNPYTYGSAARKLEVKAPVVQVQRAKAKKQKKIIVHVDPLAILGTITAVIMLIVMVVSFFQLRATQQEAAAMAQYVRELRTENDALRSEFEAGYNAEQVRYTAEALGMVPAEQVRHVTLRVEQPAPEPVSGWDNFTAFLAGLFA